MDPYRNKLLSRAPVRKKASIEGKVVAVLDTKIDNRELNAEMYLSRCLLQNEIHEFILTDEKGASPGKKVNRIAYLCFAEITKGGVVLVGDEITIRGKRIGEVAGFDATHMPNHINVIIHCEKRVTGIDLGLEPGEKIEIKGKTI